MFYRYGQLPAGYYFVMHYMDWVADGRAAHAESTPWFSHLMGRAGQAQAPPRSSTEALER
jgi:hypothetical protein